MYETSILTNGVTLVTEQVPAVRSAAIGIFIGSGSRQEQASENGAAHFAEHMFFKSTHSRTAEALASEMDAIGGQVNAYTTKESTCYYARVLDTHLERAIDLLCDMLFNSRFSEEEITTERGVILEEINMYEDTPEDLCSERLAKAVYRGSPLARPILGHAATLGKMTGDWLLDYRRSHYAPSQIVVALAGSFSSAVVETLKARFAEMTPAPAVPSAPAFYSPAVTVKKKAIEQNHLILAFPGLIRGHAQRYALQLMSSILGGGMSSRLFQEVREKKGLCYTVYSYCSSHEDTGLVGLYTALNKETEREAITTIQDTVRNFAAHGVTPEELDRVREQSKSNVLMGLESTQARMSHLGRSQLLYGRIPDPDEILACYDAVTREDIRALAENLFDFRAASLSAVGRVSTKEDYQALLG